VHSLSKVLNSMGVSYKKIGKKSTATFNSVMTMNDAVAGSLIFINKPGSRTVEQIEMSHASVVLLERAWGENNSHVLGNMETSIFLVDSPRQVITMILKRLYPDDELYYRGIHPTASIDSEAKIHPTVSIGPYCIVGKCKIGENSRVQAFSIIKDNAIIGKNVIIREYCQVGGCGFGFVRTKDGHLERMPHIGKVIIEDDVELFPYVNVDRGTLGTTQIKKGSKIDHYSHIGHNTTVGENTIITAGTVLCGGSSIGDRSWAGVGSIIKDNISVGSDVTLGMGSVVIKDVEHGQILAGVPAKALKKDK